MSRKRKRPVTHSVRSHTRDGSMVKSYTRGSGMARTRSSKTVSSGKSLGDRVNVFGGACLGMKEDVDYKVLAYSDWGDMLIPTIVKWSNGEVDDFTSATKSVANRVDVIENNFKKRKKLTDREFVLLVQAKSGVSTSDYPMEELNELMRKGMLGIVAHKIYPDRRMASATYTTTTLGNKELKRRKK